MLKYNPSVAAAGAVYAAVKISDKRSPLPSVLQEYWSTIIEEVKLCANDLVVLFQAAPKHALSTVREKFAKREFLEVSNIRIS